MKYMKIYVVIAALTFAGYALAQQAQEKKKSVKSTSESKSCCMQGQSMKKSEKSADCCATDSTKATSEKSPSQK